MTEPTRDALHEETLAMLARSEKSWRDSGIQYEDPYDISVADRFAYAAECVKRVPELEAEGAALAQYKAFVEAIDRGEIDATDYAPQRIGVLPRNGRRWFHAPTALAAYAAATREGADG